MSIELTPPVSALEDWLDTATRGLCDEAYLRIAEEIEAHVSEHVEHLQQQGLSEDEAMNTAVEELGNPRKARREFKRIHLTEREGRTLERLSDPRWARWYLAGSRVSLYLVVLWLCTFAYVYIARIDLSNAIVIQLLSSLILLPVGLWDLLSKRKINDTHAYALIIKRGIRMILCWLLYFLFFFFHIHRDTPYVAILFFLLYSASFSPSILGQVRLLRKLKMAESWKGKSDVQ